MSSVSCSKTAPKPKDSSLSPSTWNRSPAWRSDTAGTRPRAERRGLLRAQENALRYYAAMARVHPYLGIDSRKLSEFCLRWHITEMSLFGSVARRDFGVA